MIKIGIDGTKKIYIGNNSVTTVYVGTKRVFPQTNLPYDAEIEYLESTGTQWIDTGVYLDVNMNIEIGFTAEKAGIFGWIHENQVSGTWIAFRNINDASSWYQNYNTRIRANYATNPYSIKITNNSFVINDINYNINLKEGNDRISNISLKFFAWYDFAAQAVATWGSDLLHASVFKTFYIKKNNTLVFDAIPVRVGNVGYMYDKVSGQLFGNAGTGDFILGPDKN